MLGVRSWTLVSRLVGLEVYWRVSGKVVWNVVGRRSSQCVVGKWFGMASLFVARNTLCSGAWTLQRYKNDLKLVPKWPKIIPK